MELLSYRSIRQIWMEGIEPSSQRVSKCTLATFTKCMERARSQGSRLLKLMLHPLPLHLQITARTLLLTS